MAWQSVASLSELQEEEAFPVTVGKTLIALVKLGDDVHCVSNVCTHEFALLSDGIVENGCIECPLHQAQFDVATGAHRSGPACKDLQTFPVKVVDGSIHVDCE